MSGPISGLGHTKVSKPLGRQMGKARMIKCKLYSYRVFWDPETGECGKLNNVHPPPPHKCYPNPQTHEYVNLHGKRDFKAAMK